MLYRESRMIPDSIMESHVGVGPPDRGSTEKQAFQGSRKPLEEGGRVSWSEYVSLGNPR